jgi:hypothetical protein
MPTFQLFLFFLVHVAHSKLMIFPEEKIEKCPEYDDVQAGNFNYDNLEIITVSDTEIFVNGSIEFLRPVKSPWVAEYYAEQLVRNKWVRTPIQRKMPDTCKNLKDPTELWYGLMKDNKGCDYKRGVSICSVRYGLKGLKQFDLKLFREKFKIENDMTSSSFQQDSLKFNMISVTDWPIVLLPSFIGSYRMNCVGYWEIKGEKKIDCLRLYFEIAEI